MDERAKKIRRASWIAIIGNIILAVLKIVIGFISGSLAVIGDGIDSSTDIITSCITLYASGIISKPPDIKHPYGHGRAETIATKILAFVIFFAGAQLGLSTIIKIFKNESTTIPSLLAIYITIVSICGKLFIAYWQYRIGRKTESSMLIANGKNMQNDVVISLGVLTGLIFTIFLDKPILDLITALIISLWILKTSIGIFSETNTELMDGIADSTIYNDIFKAVKTVDGVFNPHRIRVRKLANMFVIDLDIEVNGSLAVSDAHKIAISVENAIKKDINNIYDIIVHVEPYGNIEHHEKFGISKEEIS